MIKAITVNLTLSKKAVNTVRAFADVTLHLDEGTLKVCGYKVLVPEDKQAWVAPPARHGEKAWFDQVVATGQVRKMIDAAVIVEFERIARNSVVK